MPHITFNYLYRDGGNYKNYRSVIFDSPSNVDLSDLDALIKSKLIYGEWFYVNEWNLPDLHFGTWDNEIDHTFHEFESVELTEEAANAEFNLDEFIIAIKQASFQQ
ncbi:MAG TPA: hypothetical protein VNW95_11745 [Mucilaginibacter sp.]|jgi:hypothetical protein|nr:hypothetical protein [Mucilaginibacter sp.]